MGTLDRPTLANTSLSLENCFQAALKRSEDLANQEELITQTEERINQARGAILPTLNGVATYLTQPPPSGLTSVSPPTQSTVKITGSQPLFRGFREFAALRQQKNLLEAGRSTREQVVIQIFKDTLLNYYQILSFEKDIVNIKNQIELSEKRIRELNYFKQLGRSRESEVLTVQATLASLEAQQEGLVSQLRSARDIFEFLTGLDRNSPLVDSELLPRKIESVGSYIALINNRPDVRSLTKSVEAAEEGITIAKGAHLPSLDLIGNYYFRRPGFLSDVNWDVQVGLILPIFSGGIIQSQVRLANSVQHQNELALSRVKRLAEQQIKQAFDIYLSDQAQFEKLKKAVNLSEKNYQAELHDYRLGLVRNLDVLQALSASQETRRAKDRMGFQLKADYLNLQAVAALRPYFAGSSQELQLKSSID